MSGEKGEDALSGEAAGLDAGFTERLAEVVGRIGTAVKAAQIADVARNQITRWQKLNQRPPLEAMIKLARAADVSLQWLATGEGPKESHEALLRAGLPASELVQVPRVLLSLEPGADPPGLRRTGRHGVETIAAARQYGNLDPRTLVLADAIGLGMAPAVFDNAELTIDTAQTEVRPQGGLYVFAQGDQVFIRWLQRDPAGILIGEPGKESADRVLTVPITVLGRVVGQHRRVIHT